MTCIVLIWVLCLAPGFPETPLSHVRFIDKWTHLVMYGGTCTVIWAEYLRRHAVPLLRRLFLFAWLAPVIMSGFIEILQATVTTTRSGEWLDFLANTAGATLAGAVGLLLLIARRGQTQR